VGILVGGALMLWPLTWLNGFDSVFQIATAACTAGFSTASIGDLGPGTLGFLTIVMLIGASAGSTCGGLKLARLVRLIRPGVPDPAFIETPRRTRVIAATFLMTFVIGTLAVWQTSGAPLIDAAFESASALATVGLSAGVTAPDAPAAARLTLIALMWLGRLETILFAAAILKLIERRASGE
jgi:trk system potassium uptake protein TrkH